MLSEWEQLTNIKTKLEETCVTIMSYKFEMESNNTKTNFIIVVEEMKTKAFCILHILSWAGTFILDLLSNK